MTRPSTPLKLEISQAAAQKLRRLLKKWYAAHHRPLPWRARPRRLGRGAAQSDQPVDPYHVLLSEAMLQQTQVATVAPYFERFVTAFATLADLAEADEQEVLRLWQGLGYYRRARNLHAAARQVVDEHGGELPRDVASLRKLPGVGEYTAGAIASIAFDKPVPLLDGNVARVLARWLAVEQPVDAPATKKALWSLAGELVPRQGPGDWNQALMELGATICTPRNPRCLMCPVASLCRAHQRGLANELPRKLPRKQPTAVRHDVIAADRRGRLLLEQRPAEGLWGNMWQLPTREADPADASRELARRGDQHATDLAQWFTARFGVRLDNLQPLGSFTHQTTHRRIGFHLWRATIHHGRLRPGTAIWRRPGNVDDLPLANPQRRALSMLQQSPP